MLKKAISAFTIACMLTSALSFNVFAQSKAPNKISKRFDKTLSTNSKNDRKPGQLIIKYKNDASLKADKKNITRDEGKLLKSQRNGLALIEVAENKLAEKMESLKQNSNIEYVVPNYIRTVAKFPDDVPNDPEYKNQWGLQNINAPKAWTAIDNTSLKEVVVAVIDTGLDMEHEDLKDRLTKGYDFVDMDEDPSPGPVNEEHATHVAGILAASTDNGIGIAGTAGTAPIKIMPIRVLEAGSGDDFTIAQGITYAVDNGARVINMSLCGYGDSPLLTEACNYAFSKNVVVVAGAGNNAMDVNTFYPASIPGVITVSATDVNDTLAFFSNYGSSVELAAPGVEVLSSLPGDLYESYDGTSMSTPFVSAACALLISKNPLLSIIEVEQYLTDSAKDIGSTGKDESFGYGLLDLGNALNTTVITPRLEIINLSNNATVYDLMQVQTRFTYPNKIVNTDLYIDETVVDSIYNESVSDSVYCTNMFNNFEIDTYKFRDGTHTLKVVAEDIENQTYSKEIKINIRNNVYTGLRVKLSQDGAPVSGAYVEVWNKYQQNNETYYNYCYSSITSKNGVAVVPGSSAPNGNDYVIVANYEFKNGNEFSYATLVEEATAPGVIELNGDNLVPVTVDTGLTSTKQYLLANYNFPSSNQGFGFVIPDLDADGSFETFLNPGSYFFEAYGLPSETEGSTDEPIFMLKSEEVKIDSGNFYVAMDSDIDSLAKVDINYKNIHGFIPQDTYFTIGCEGSPISIPHKIDDISDIPGVYATPGSYFYSFDLIGQRNNQAAYIALNGKLDQIDSYDENILTFGGTFTGKIGLDKKKFVPGENLIVDSSVTDSYGNKLIYMEFMYDNPFAYVVNKNLISYKTAANKVEFKAADTAIKALKTPAESVLQEEPVEVEYKFPATLSLIDSRNNIIKTEPQDSAGYLPFLLPQSLATNNYKLKFILDLPYLIQAETSLIVDRVIKNNAVKFTIELPDKTKATSADVEIIDTITGHNDYYYGEDLLNGELYVPVPKGNYKFIISTYKSDVNTVDSTLVLADNEPIVIHETSAVYIKDGKSPANYNLSSSQLQKVEFSAKDEEGKTIDNPSNYYLTIPCTSTENYTLYLGSGNEENYIRDIYITKGTYNFSAEIYTKDGSLIERLLYNPNIKIGLNTKNTQALEFKSDNLTEVSLDKKSDQSYIECVITDPKNGFSTYLFFVKGKSVKVTKGFYTLDFICQNTQYGITYLYLMTSQKDFSSDNTYLNCEADFSMTITPNKAIYKTGETLKTTNVISDRYGNRVVDLISYDLFGKFSEKLHNSKGKFVLKKHQGELKFFDIATKDYIDIPYYDIRAPFINIKDSFGDVIFTAKSPDFYTHSKIKLDYDWISSGIYKIEWTLDIDADGNLSAENTFRVK